MPAHKVTRIPFPCEICGEIFFLLPCCARKKHRKRFCSDGCRRLSFRQSVPCVCHVCGTGFSVFANEVKRNSRRGQFCSYACLNRSRPKPLLESFWNSIGKKTATGCILWAGSFDSKGYGRITRKRKAIKAHRLAYELMVGAIPEGLNILHECDNPPCVNPVHLFPGTLQDNNADKIAKGRQARGEACNLSNLTNADVLEIRRRYATGGTSQPKLAKEFGVSYPSIGAIVRRETWVHV